MTDSVDRYSPNKNIRLLAGWFLICLPLVFNPSIIRLALSGYVGEGLSGPNKRLIYAVQMLSILCGILVIKRKEDYLKKALNLKNAIVFLPLFTPIMLTTVYFVFTGVRGEWIINLVVGELLTVPVLFFLILLVPKSGICLSFIFLSITNFISFFHIVIYSQPISRIDFMVIIETNKDESWEYITSYISSFPFLVYWLLCGFAMWVLIKMVKKTKVETIRLSVLPLLLISMLPFSYKESSAMIYNNNIFCLLNKASHEYDNIRGKLDEAMNADIGPVRISNPAGGPEVHLIIIDESANRGHMSFYGYQRDTTAELMEWGDELLVFNDVISPDCYTIPIMKKFFTFLNYEYPAKAWEKGTMFQYLQKAGYHTYWISSQSRQGINDTLVSVLADICDETYFIRQDLSVNDSGFDEDLLGWLEKTLKTEQKKKFIFVHMIGKHVKYSHRFPETSIVYSGNIEGKTAVQSKIINDYDNAVRYNSAIIASMIKSVKNLNVYSTVLYLSDHADEVCEINDRFGHSEWRSSRYMYEIPFVLWVSDLYKQNNPQKVSEIRQYLNRKYMTDDLIHSVLDLLNIETGNLQTSRSVFSPDFISRPRIIGEKNKQDYDMTIGRVEITLSQIQSILTNRLDCFRNKVWAHRVNSIGKLKETAHLYRGVEFDVVFLSEKKAFDINHPPAESIGLTLDKYWGSVDNSDSLYYWVDFKNLTQDNSISALHRLYELVKKYGIAKEKVIVESSNPSALKKFKDKGFVTSYYLPTKTLDELDEKRKENIAITESVKTKKMQELFQSSEVDGISANARFYDLLEIIFPEVKQVFLWNTTLEYYNEHDANVIEKFLHQNDRIKVLLTLHESKHTR